MTAPSPPDEGVAVRVPVSGCLRDGLYDRVPGLEAAAGESQRAQHLPPRLDEVEVGGILRLEHHLPARVRQHEQEHVGGAMAAQVVGDGVDPLDPSGQPGFDLLQEGHPVGGATARVGPGEGGAGRRAEGAEDVALAAPAVVDLLPGPPGGWRLWSNQVPARVALGTDGAHLVEANDYAAVWRR